MTGEARTPQRVVIVGGAGGVGEGIVRALLASPRAPYVDVLVTSRDASRLRDLHAALDGDPRVHTIVGDVASSHSAERLRDAVAVGGPIDAVIASLGGWWTGHSLVKIDDATWHATLDALLTTHWACARAFIPLLEATRGKYLGIGGGAALAPVPSSSLVSIAGAAQIMLMRALVAERGDVRPPLIAELVITGPIATNAAHHGPTTPNEITAREVGAAIVPWLLHGGAPQDARFAWPADRLERSGPIWTMRR